ncbi:IAA-amino acid hydrolase ILR1-like 1 [Panicum miliaceum]|uniref:IAA-amino acid hydrolase ILR1-like 1 n=1 Tax=Panicum miliaceum TaxID=4540 RepID=A0A3L6R9M2_PANMI|nr:IAA-amino acid hydrolase ILR1-like 1 [Panicum miliaceum]
MGATFCKRCGVFEAAISGKGGHAALSCHTIDPILAASNVIVSLQQLVLWEADPLDSQVTVSQVSVQRCSVTLDFLTRDLPLFPPASNSPEPSLSLFVDVASEMVEDYGAPKFRITGAFGLV